MRMYLKSCNKPEREPAPYSHVSYPQLFKIIVKGIVEWVEPSKCIILLISRILWHKRINPSLKEWRFWYLILTDHFSPWCTFPVHAVPLLWRLLIYIRKNLWHRVLEANKKQVTLKSFSLEIRIGFVNQILKNKERVK